jgi:hypothetical protein
LAQVSVDSQVLLPQVSGHLQSREQLLQSSPKTCSHLPLPQHLPQSPGQSLQFSPGSQVPLPQVSAPQPPHWFLHSLTQMLSQWLLQQ